MAKLMDLLNTTTGDFEKRNEAGEQYLNEGYSNRIRLRESSHANILENLMNYASVSEVSIETPIVDSSSDSSYTMTVVDGEVEQISTCKAIMLNSEKFSNLSSRIGYSIEENSDIDVKITEDNVVADEQAIVDSESDVVENTDDAVSIELSMEEVSYSSAVIDDVYDQIMKQTEKTLQAKKLAIEAEEEVARVEEEVKQKVEESNQRLLEKSAEQAEILARQAAAEAELEQIERAIADVYNTQKKSMGIAEQSYIEREKKSRTKIQELQDQGARQTRENEEKIEESQKVIDQGITNLTQVTDKIARKQKILAALTNSVGFDNTNDNLVNFNSTVEEVDTGYRKIA